MKQQKPPVDRPKTQPDWPSHPQMPHLKTIGGEADKALIDNHNENTRNWDFDMQTKLNQQLEELGGEIRDLKARVSVLEKAAVP